MPARAPRVGQRGHRPLGDGREVHAAAREGDLPRRHPGHIEQVVDQVGEVVGLAADHVVSARRRLGAAAQPSERDLVAVGERPGRPPRHVDQPVELLVAGDGDDQGRAHAFRLDEAAAVFGVHGGVVGRVGGAQ